MLRNRPTANVHEEADRIVEALLARDEFVHRFAAEVLRDEVLAAGILEADRWRSLAQQPQAPGAETMRAAIIADVRREIAEGAADWLMPYTFGTRRVDMMKLDRATVCRYAERSHLASLELMRDAEWLRLIGERMRDGQVVGDVWTVDELTALRSEINVSFVSSLNAGGTA